MLCRSTRRKWQLTGNDLRVREHPFMGHSVWGRTPSWDTPCAGAPLHVTQPSVTSRIQWNRLGGCSRGHSDLFDYEHCYQSHKAALWWSYIHGLWPTRLLCPWDSPGKNTGVGCHFLLQRIFPTQEWNPYLLRLLHWQADSSTAEPPRKVLHLNGAY